MKYLPPEDSAHGQRELVMMYPSQRHGASEVTERHQGGGREVIMLVIDMDWVRAQSQDGVKIFKIFLISWE